MKIINQQMYEMPRQGGSVTGNLVEVIGEQLVEDDGQRLDLYLYNIVGYQPKNGQPFAALKCNIILF